MSGILETIVVFCLGMVAGGYLTIKGLVWGVALGFFYWIVAPMASISRQTLVADLGSSLTRLVFAFPNAILKAGGQAHADNGILGVLAVALFAIVGGALYIVGIYIGCKYWPEIKLAKSGFSRMMSMLL